MKWLRTHYIFVIMAVIFLAVAWIFQPKESDEVGKTILLVLGILAVVGMLMGGVYLYSKRERKSNGGEKKQGSTYVDSTKKFLGGLAGRDKIGTAVLVGLFLLTLSYTVGGREEWTDSLGWWWNSKIFLPSLIAVIGTIFFVDVKWRKKINNALIFVTGAMILFSLIVATPAITDRPGKDDKNKETKKVAAPRAPQNVVAKPVEVEKTRTEKILAGHGDFTEVELPPTEKLIHVGWEVPPEYRSRCLVKIEQEGRSGTQVFPCGQEKSFLKVVKISFSSEDPLEGVPVEVKITYLTAE